MAEDIGPYNRATIITKHDTTNLEQYLANQMLTRAIYVGGAGVVVVVFEDNTTAAFTCVAGQVLPVAAKRVNSTNTTATLLLALYRI